MKNRSYLIPILAGALIITYYLSCTNSRKDSVNGGLHPEAPRADTAKAKGKPGGTPLKPK